jgi:hypothetical protein
LASSASSGSRSRSGGHGSRAEAHSFIGHFLLSLLFFPLALIMAYVVKDRRGGYMR